jgi:hypothetical protein
MNQVFKESSYENAESKERIVIISFSNIDKDVRLLRHIAALASRFSITTITYGPQVSSVDCHFQIPNGVTYLPISPLNIIRAVSKRFKKLDEHIPANKWTKEILQSINYDILMLIDVETLPLIKFANNAAKIVVDLYEYAPREMEEDWRFRILLMKYHYYLCKTFLPSANQISTVSPGLAHEYMAQFDLKNVHVIRNARELSNLERHDTTSLPIRLVHTGLAAKSRVLENMIFAVGGLQEFHLDLYLVAAPFQRRYLKRLHRISRRYDNVKIKNPVPSHSLPQLINEYDIGLLVISPSNFSLLHALPNKLFDCVQARVGVVVGPSPDMSEFVTSAEVGFVTADFTSLSIRQTLQGLTFEQINECKLKTDNLAKLVNSDSEGNKLLAMLSTN